MSSDAIFKCWEQWGGRTFNLQIIIKGHPKSSMHCFEHREQSFYTENKMEDNIYNPYFFSRVVFFTTFKICSFRNVISDFQNCLDMFSDVGPEHGLPMFTALNTLMPLMMVMWSSHVMMMCWVLIVMMIWWLLVMTYDWAMSWWLGLEAAPGSWCHCTKGKFEQLCKLFVLAKNAILWRLFAFINRLRRVNGHLQPCTFSI